MRRATFLLILALLIPGAALADPQRLETGGDECTLPKMDFDKSGLDAIESASDSGPYRKWIDSHVAGARDSINAAAVQLTELPSGPGAEAQKCLDLITTERCYYGPTLRCLNAITPAKAPGVSPEKLKAITDGLTVYVYNLSVAWWGALACEHNKLPGCPSTTTVRNWLSALEDNAIALATKKQAQQAAGGGQNAGAHANGTAGHGGTPPPPLTGAAGGKAGGTPGATAGEVRSGADSGGNSGNKSGRSDGDAASKNTSGGSRDDGSQDGSETGTSLKGEGYKSPSHWRVSSAAANPPPKPVDCPESGGANPCPHGPAGSTVPVLPNGALAVVDAVSPEKDLKLKAARALFGSQVTAYLRQLLITDTSYENFDADLGKLIAACSDGKSKFKNILSKAEDQKQLSTLLEQMASGARAAWSSSKPTPAAIQASHRNAALAAAAQLSYLRGDISRLREDFNEAPPELKDHWPSWAPFQTAITILDASSIGIRERFTTNDVRPCSNINSFGWGGPWVGSIDAQPADTEFSAADEQVIFGHGLLTGPGGDRVATNKMQRCKVKASIMDREAEQMAKILSAFPELGEKTGDGGGFVFDAVTSAKGGPEAAKKLLDQYLAAGRNKDDGPLARMRENLGNMCGDPVQAGESVFQDDQLLSAFMSCGGTERLPAAESGTSSSGKAQAECADLRRKAGLVCLIKNEVRATATYKQVAFGTLMTGLDIWGSFALGGSAAKSLVQKTLLADVAASFSREGMKGLVFGAAIGGGMGLYGVASAQTSAEQATGNYYSGRASVEAYQGALTAASDEKKSFLKNLLLGTLVGHALGGGAHGSKGVFDGPLGDEYARITSMPEGAAKDAASADFSRKFRVEFARQLGIQPSELARFSDAELMAIAEINRTASLTPRGRKLKDDLEHAACQLP
jgi:hypothetical protein